MSSCHFLPAIDQSRHTNSENVCKYFSHHYIILCYGNGIMISNTIHLLYTRQFLSNCSCPYGFINVVSSDTTTYRCTFMLLDTKCTCYFLTFYCDPYFLFKFLNFYLFLVCLLFIVQ